MIYFLLFLLGLCLGSFVNAFVWRFRIRDQKTDIRNLNKKSNIKHQTSDFSITKGRSMCPHCHHTLAWYDLLPVLCWVSLRGKCRYCKKPISAQYPLVELLVAVLFVISYMCWPLQFNSSLLYIEFALWLLLIPLLIALCIYDLKWLELPTEMIYGTFAISFIAVLIAEAASKNTSVIEAGIIGSIGLGGLFWLLYQFSGGKWIGGGDVRLGFAMGLYLGWQKSLLGLSLAAYIGTVVIVVALIFGKYHRRMKLPFGPLLIAGWIICTLWGQAMINWYLHLIGA